MAANVKDKRCHLCDEIVETLIDDDPFGYICVRCEDATYAQWMEVGDDYPLVEH